MGGTKRIHLPNLPARMLEPSPAHVMLLIGSGASLFLGSGFVASRVAFLDWPLAFRIPTIVVLLLAASHGVHLMGWVAHEGIHLILHRNRYVSVILGTFCGAMAGFNAVGYGAAHWNHHRFTNQVSDPDARIYSRFRGFWRRLLLARIAAERTHAENLGRLALGKPLALSYEMPFGARAQRMLAWANIGCLLFWAVAYATAAAFDPAGVIFAVALPVAIGMPVSGLRGYVEHAGTGLGAFRDARTYAAWPFTWLLFGNNHHLEHHLYPTVPCYRLPAVHRHLAATGFFARCDSPVETGILGALVHATSAAQYPSAAFGNLTHDPFHPTQQPHASAA